MKQISKFLGFLFLGIVLQSCIVSQKPDKSLFSADSASKDSQFVSINVPMFLAKPVIKKALREDGESPELISLISKIKDVKIFTVENGSPEMLANLTDKLAAENFQDWATVNSHGQQIAFRAKQNGDVIHNLVVSVNSGAELVYIDVKGRFTADDISKIISYSEKNGLKTK